MAKLKFNSRPASKREIFNNTGDLFALDREDVRLKRGTVPPTRRHKPSDPSDLEVHPSIADFVVNTRLKSLKAAQRRPMRSPSTDPD